MENTLAFDFFNPLFGRLEFDAALNRQLIYNCPEFEPRHFPIVNNGNLGLKSSHTCIMGVKEAGEFISTGISKKVDPPGKQVETTKLLLEILHEKDGTIKSILNEIKEFKKKVADQDVIINKLNDQVSILQEKTNADGGANKVERRNGVAATECIIKKRIDVTVQDDGLKATDAVNLGNITSSDMQHEDIFPQNVLQRDAKMIDNSDDLIDVSCGKKSSQKLIVVSSGKNNFCDLESSDSSQRVKEKIIKTIGKFECCVCHKRLTSKTKLNIHHRIHTDERPYPCCVCKKSFRQRGNLSEHISRLHKHSLDKNANFFVRRPGPEGFRCCFCLQLMKSRELYEKHISRIHVDLLPKIQ